MRLVEVGAPVRVTLACLSLLCLMLLTAEAVHSPDEVIHESNNPFAAEAAAASSYLAKTSSKSSSPSSAGVPIEEPQAVSMSDPFAKEVDAWDAETSGGENSERDPNISSGPETYAGEVPVEHQGDREAQVGMLKATEEAMTDSAAAISEHAHMAAASPTPPPSAVENQHHGPPMPPPSVHKVDCTTVEACQRSAQEHVKKAGEAVEASKESKEKGNEARVIRLDKRAQLHKTAAIEATVKARELAEEDGEAARQRQAERVLAKASDNEMKKKQTAKQARDFHKSVETEAETKKQAKLDQLKKTVEEKADKQTAAKAVAKAKEKEASEAEDKATADKTATNRAAAQEAKSEANKAFDELTKDKDATVEKKTKAETLGAEMVTSKHLSEDRLACKKGEKMAKELCTTSHTQALKGCGNTESEVESHIGDSLDGDPTVALTAEKACVQKANKDQSVCEGLAAKRRTDCETVAATQTRGASIAGYVLKLTASIGIEEYNRKLDFDLRSAIAKRVGLSRADVVTISVKPIGIESEIQVAIAGPEAPLHAKLMALLAALGSGEPIGGVTATESAIKYQKSLTLPGQKPASWSSEQAQKAWKVSQAETRKLVGMPSGSSAKEVNRKAHSSEMTSKRKLALARTKEYKLKKESTEMTTKVEQKAAQKREEDRVREAEKLANSGLNKFSKTTDGSQMDMHANSGGGNGGVLSHGDADFQVSRQRWWKDTGSWLLSTYPALHAALDAAKKEGQTKDEFWMRFLLNWFYTKGREKMGYRYTWNEDGSYSPVRHVILGCRRYTQKSVDVKGNVWESGPSSPSSICHGASTRNVYSVSVRSVNNLCYPGVSNSDAREHRPAGGGHESSIDSISKACQTSNAVSVRLSRFRLMKPPRAKSSGLMTGMNGAPAMFLMRAYKSINPKHYHRSWEEYADIENEGLMGVHRIKWSINMVAEYCEVPLEDGTAKPYDENKSWPRRLTEAGKLTWSPITISNMQKKNSDVTVTVIRLNTKDEKLQIICRATQSEALVNGKRLSPTDTKCDIKVTSWPYKLSCPEGKTRGLAILTSVMTRYDDATDPEDAVEDPEASQVNVNAHKMFLKFQKTASLRVLKPNGKWENRGSVYMRMNISEPHWIPDSNFQSHRHYDFSFGLTETAMNKVSSSELLWDPQLSSNFEVKAPPQQLDLSQAVPKKTPVKMSHVIGHLFGVSPSMYDKETMSFIEVENAAMGSSVYSGLLTWAAAMLAVVWAGL